MPKKALTQKERELAELAANDPCPEHEETAQLGKLVLKLARRIDRNSAGPGRGNSKGKAFERRVANVFAGKEAPSKDCPPTPLYTEAERNPCQSRSAARDGCDVEKTDFWIEAKNTQRGSPFRFMRQALDDKEKRQDTRTPIVVMTRNHEPELVVMLLQDWITLADCAMSYEKVFFPDPELLRKINEARAQAMREARGESPI